LEHAIDENGLAAGEGVSFDLRGSGWGNDLPGATSFCAEFVGSAWAARDDDA